MKRRTFVTKTLQTGIALSAFPLISSCNKEISGVLPKRRLGRTGEKLSIIGFGGIIVSNIDQDEANNRVSKAIDQGCNYFDVAPTYGNAEDMLGPAFEPYRKDCFLACKTQKRDAAGAEEELHSSLKKLRTDYFDLYQLHAISSVDDVEQAFGPGGAMETFMKAKEEGLVRYLGFSAHSQEAALLAMEKFDFDTILIPVNFVCWFQGNFGPAALAKAKEKGMGILALKALAFTRIPQGEPRVYEKAWYVPIEDETVGDLSLRFTYSQGATAAIPPGEYKFWDRAVNIAMKSTEISEGEISQLQKTAEGVEPLFSA
jgi:predicted aldo/keto reductase-like oxidoreductase